MPMSFDRDLKQVCASLYGASGRVSPTAALPEEGVDALVALLKESARSLLVEGIEAELRHFRDRSPSRAPREGGTPWSGTDCIRSG